HTVLSTAPASTQIYSLSLHDALPISVRAGAGVRPSAAGPDLRARRAAGAFRQRQRGADGRGGAPVAGRAVAADAARLHRRAAAGDRKSTRLNSSHVKISYAVFCLKKK